MCFCLFFAKWVTYSIMSAHTSLKHPLRYYRRQKYYSKIKKAPSFEPMSSVLDTVDFHYMDTNSWNILQNSFICIPQKKVSHSFVTTRGWEIITRFSFFILLDWWLCLNLFKQPNDCEFCTSLLAIFWLYVYTTSKQHNIIKLSYDCLQSIVMFPSTYFYAHFGMSHKRKLWMETPICV